MKAYHFHILGISGQMLTNASITHSGFFSSLKIAQSEGKVNTYQDTQVLLAINSLAGANAQLVQHPGLPITAACMGRLFVNESAKSNCEFPDFSIALMLYEQFGIAFPARLIGEYAMIIWDGRHQQLHLVRDHLGTRSLFYVSTTQWQIAANSIKGLFGTGLINKHLAHDAPSHYFANKALSAPRTMFDDINAVRPAHVVSLDAVTAPCSMDYWKLHDINVQPYRKADSFREELKNLIDDAVRIRCPTQASLGAIISGGVDSSTVVTTLLSKGLVQAIDGFSIGFAETSYSDEELQDQLVNALPKYAIKHHRVILSAQEFQHCLEAAVSYLDNPVNDVALVGMYRVFQEGVKHGIEIMFEGEGPDEIFPAGNTHGEREILQLMRWLPKALRPLLRSLFHSLPVGDTLKDKIWRYATRAVMDEHERMMTWRTYFHHVERRRLLLPDWHSTMDPYAVGKDYLQICRNTDPLNRYQYGLIKTFLVDDLLFKNEKMALAAGVSNSTPLIDKRIVECALRIPSTIQIAPPNKCSDGIKLLYKQAISDRVPPAIVQRKKARGFSQPTAVWFRNELREFMTDTCLNGHAVKMGIIDRDYVKQLVDSHVNKRGNYDYPLNSILVFSLWLKHVMPEN